MKITDSYINNQSLFNEADIILPLYNQDEVRKNTQLSPRWLHFGGGNLYRCFHAKIAQDLLNQNELETGIVVVDNFGEKLIKDIYQKNDCRSLTVVMKADGTFEKEVIASTANAYFNNPSHSEDLETINSIISNESLQLVTLTITEKGYGVKDSGGKLLSTVALDIKAGPVFARLSSTMAQIAYYLFQRFEKNQAPLALVSTDNFSHNGDRLKESLRVIVKGWVELNHIPVEFYNYMFDSKKISYPYSMIDRITPGPSEKIAQLLLDEGIEGMELKTYPSGPPLAAFVNTEEVCYLAIEDNFPNGRPPLDKAANVFLADREIINNADLMKVTTCLNPLHTALAITGSLLNYSSIYETVQDVDLLKLIEFIGYKEGLPVVKDPGIINPKEFIDEVIYKRFMNPNIPDTPQRIATDTSQKLAVRFGETISSYAENDSLDPKSLTFIPFVIAAWCRYLIGIDDQGEAFIPSPDPLYDELLAHVKHFSLGNTEKNKVSLSPILSNVELFGVDLYEVGLGKKIEELFSQIMSGKGAVKATLHELIIKEEQIHGNDI